MDGGWIGGWMGEDGWMNAWIDERMGGWWMDGVGWMGR